MKVRTTIKFEVEYSCNLEFYETTDEEKALEVERDYATRNPVTIIDVFEAKDMGTFTVSVEKI